MSDDMFFSDDERALRRGKRVAKRTETCRPCLVRTKGPDEMELEGVVLDVSPYGVLVRMIESIPLETEVTVQLMRDEDFEVPFSDPLDGTIVRYEGSPSGFTDHGIRIKREDIQRIHTTPIQIEPRRPQRGTTRPSRMHTIDFTVGDDDRGRSR